MTFKKVLSNLQKGPRDLLTPSWPRPGWDYPLLQAHRGFWVEGEDENSLGALAQAKTQGFEMAEIDIQLSADEIPVVFHDRNLIRMKKVNLKVASLTARELESWGIPRLSDALATKKRPDFLNVELKKDRWNSLLEKKVAQVVKETKRTEEIIFSSFYPHSLWAVSEFLPRVPRALLIELNSRHWLSYFRTGLLPLSRAHLIHWPYQLLSQALVEFLKSMHQPVVTWTVNDYRVAKELYDWGVDSLITDRILPKKFPR